MFIIVLICYYKDAKKYGKDKLAVTLTQRLFSYFICVPLPIILGMILR